MNVLCEYYFHRAVVLNTVKYCLEYFFFGRSLLPIRPVSYNKKDLRSDNTK